MKIEMTLLLKYQKIIIKEIYEKKNLVKKEKLYILQYIYQKQENNSAILKQKKIIDKLDNDNKIMDQKKMKLYSRWPRTRYRIWF